MTPRDRASRGWEAGCLLLMGALLSFYWIEWWALLAVPVALWLMRHEQPGQGD